MRIATIFRSTPDYLSPSTAQGYAQPLPRRSGAGYNTGMLANKLVHRCLRVGLPEDAVVDRPTSTAYARGGVGPARTYRIPGAVGTVGMISPRGEHFCERCNRLRLTADGFLRPCLLGEHEVEVRGALRRGDPIDPLLRQAAALKPEKNELCTNRTASNRWMAEIGG